MAKAIGLGRRGAATINVVGSIVSWLFRETMLPDQALVLCPLKGVALSVDIADVLFHGVDGDVESNADRFIGAADLAQQPHFCFSGG